MTGPYIHFRTDTFLHRSNHTVCLSQFALHMTLPKPAALYSMSSHQMPMYSAQGTTSSIIPAHLESNLSSAAILSTLIVTEQVRSLHHSGNHNSQSSRSYASYGRCQLSWPSSSPTTMDVQSSLLQKAWKLLIGKCLRSQFPISILVIQFPTHAPSLLLFTHPALPTLIHSS